MAPVILDGGVMRRESLAGSPSPRRERRADSGREGIVLKRIIPVNEDDRSDGGHQWVMSIIRLVIVIAVTPRRAERARGVAFERRRISSPRSSSRRIMRATALTPLLQCAPCRSSGDRYRARD